MDTIPALARSRFFLAYIEHMFICPAGWEEIYSAVGIFFSIAQDVNRLQAAPELNCAHSINGVPSNQPHISQINKPTAPATLKV